ncbi:MAG: hypothetical protein E7372_04975 [Clostridiales bacterium]|nr:hypothetical protein [Clostridiales bacterium]
MSLEKELRDQIQSYCTKDLPGDLDWHIQKFACIDNMELKERLGRAFYSARYMSKLMEALYAKDNELHPFLKFQVMQYASIYEAVISYLLWDKFTEHPEVIALQTHKAYKPVSALGASTSVTYDGEQVYTCLYKDSKTPKNSIPFSDKVDCCVRIGFIEEKYAEDIKKVYMLRNLAHIETEAKKQIEIEIEHSKLGYWRIQPFLEKIDSFLNETE